MTTAEVGEGRTHLSIRSIAFGSALAVASVLLLSAGALDQTPRTTHYQGYLTSGVGVPVNTTVPMVFRIFDALTGGTGLWTEAHPSVTVAV